MIRTSHTLSSTARRSYWLGRYLERAESSARLVMVNSRLLYDLPRRMPLGWRGLLEITASRELFDSLYSESNEKTVSRYLVNDLRNPGSLMNSLGNARENVRTLRGIIPREAVELVNDVSIYAKETLSEPLSRTRRDKGLSEVKGSIQRIEGFMSSSMLHDAHWSFLRLGNFVERADMTSRIIEVGCDDLFDDAADLEPFSDIQWRNVLMSLDAQQSYNQVVQGPVHIGPVLEFLTHHRQLPRSLAYPLNAIRNSVRDLPRNDKVLRLVNRLRRVIANTDVAALDIDALRAFLDGFQLALVEIDDAINKTYFTFTPRRQSKKTKRRET